MNNPSLSRLTVCIKGAGEMASGVACRLYAANIKRIVMLEISQPLAVRRKVAFCEAVYEGSQSVEDVGARKVDSAAELEETWSKGLIAIRVDPEWATLKEIHVDVVIDAILAKKNLGTRIGDARLVIGLGPGFTAGADVHCVIETNRGHKLGRVIRDGSAEPNTGIPGKIGQFTSERVLRSPDDGEFTAHKSIGDMVSEHEAVGDVSGINVCTEISGVIRGLIRNHTPVKAGLKLGDIDPRSDITNCHTISEKARAIGGSVLEAVLAEFNRPETG